MLLLLQLLLLVMVMVSMLLLLMALARNECASQTGLTEGNSSHGCVCVYVSVYEVCERFVWGWARKREGIRRNNKNQETEKRGATQPQHTHPHPHTRH